jgi:LysR family glycine cleavage system transcriptional activator
VFRVPPLFTLRALEAAVRHRSYSRAAAELSVTHGAISQQIRKLEAEFGARLFERRGNAMIPLPETERLAGEIADALNILRVAVDEFVAGAENDPLMVSLDPRFAARWLAPKLTRLLASPAGANLDLRVEERLADFLSDGVDLAVRYGAGDWEGVHAEHLFAERLYVVCSPAFAAAHPIAEPADLLNIPLLHHRHRPWWLWFQRFGLAAPEPRGTVFDDSLMLLAAAGDGLGAALGRSGLIEEDLRTGRLIRLIEAGVASELGYFVVWSLHTRKLRRVEALRDWLVAEATSQPDS